MTYYWTGSIMFRVNPPVHDEPMAGITPPGEGGSSAGGGPSKTTIASPLSEIVEQAAGGEGGEASDPATTHPTARDHNSDPYTALEPTSEPMMDDLLVLDSLPAPEPATTTFSDARRQHERDEIAIL